MPRDPLPPERLPALEPEDHENFRTAAAITLAELRGDRAGARELARSHDHIVDLVESMASVAISFGVPLAQSHNDTLEQLLSDILLNLEEQGSA